MRLGRWCLLVCVVAAAVGSCAEPFNTERVTPERSTLGAEIFRVVCKQVAAGEIPTDVSGSSSRALCDGLTRPTEATTPRLKALVERRAELVTALDEVFPESIVDDLDRFMVDLVPFYDPPNRELPRTTEGIAHFLQVLATDEEALAALERMSQRRGYRPADETLSLLIPLLRYPRLNELASASLAGVSSSGEANEEAVNVFRSLAAALATYDGDAVNTETLRKLRELAFETDPTFAAGAPTHLLRRDRRGLAVPRVLRLPFVDTDSDGLADVDDHGRFIGANGEPLVLPTPFAVEGESSVVRDALGRALAEDGLPLFATMDLDDTLLMGLSREAGPLFDSSGPTLFDLASGLPLLLGPDAVVEETHGDHLISFMGYDTTAGPLFDSVHAGGQLSVLPESLEALAATQTLLSDHQPVLASAVRSMLASADAARSSNAALQERSELWDDVLQVGDWIASEPGLMEALLRAMADPRSRRLGTILGEMMRYRDRPDWDRAQPTRILRDQAWDEPVDRTAPEGEDNASLFQQSIAIIHDLDGVRVCNKAGARLHLRVLGLSVSYPLFGGTYDECELLEINNVAEAYALSVIGQYELDIKDGAFNSIISFGERVGLDPDRVLESSSGIPGLTRHPTPEALNRMVFQREGNAFLEGIFDAVPTRDGVPVTARHRPIIFSWERAFAFCGEEVYALGQAPCSNPEVVTYFQAMTPILEAFARYDRRTEGRFLFDRLISAFHRHWPSPQNTRFQEENPSAAYFAVKDNARSYESIVANILADCGPTETGSCTADGGYNLHSALSDLARTTTVARTPSGTPVATAFANFASAAASSTRHPTLTTRSGATSLATNRGTRNASLTPLLLLVDSLSRFESSLARDPADLTRWRAARSRFADTFLATEVSAGGTRFTSPRLVAAAKILTRFAEREVRSHHVAGDVAAWAGDLTTDAESLGRNAVFVSLMRLLRAARDDEEAKRELAAFVEYLIADDNRRLTITSVADTLQLLEDEQNLTPLARATAEAIAPGIREGLLRSQPLIDIGVREGAVQSSIDLLAATSAADDRRVLSRVLSAASSAPNGTPPPLLRILESAAEVHRLLSGSESSLDRDDIRRVLLRIAEYLADENHGIARLFRVVESRTLQ